MAVEQRGCRHQVVRVGLVGSDAPAVGSEQGGQVEHQRTSRFSLRPPLRAMRPNGTRMIGS